MHMPALTFFLSLLFLNMAAAAPLRVMVWNVHHGQGADGKVSLEALADVIRAQKPDIAILQEIDKGVRRSGGVDQAAELARLLDMHGTFGRAIQYDGGEYGLAVLSRGKILASKVHPLPKSQEQRIGFVVTVEHGEEEITVINTHLDVRSRHGERLLQAKAVAELAKEAPKALLAGDFNDTPGSDTLRAISAIWNKPVEKADPKETCPADQPTVEIDHLFARGLRVLGMARVIPETRASDHRPVVADFETTTKDAPGAAQNAQGARLQGLVGID